MKEDEGGGWNKKISVGLEYVNWCMGEERIVSTNTKIEKTGRR